jgi:hypothetical protein
MARAIFCKAFKDLGNSVAAGHPKLEKPLRDL